VVLLPNGFTLANLLCGIYAIVQASRANYDLAVRFVLIGGLADALDGRVARATGSGSRYGEELDSLVDAISFGLAPAMIMFFAVLNTDNWDWLLVFFFASCAVMRLARFNVEQAGRPKTHFHGLPTPAAGLALASYWWFSNTLLYKQTVILFTSNTTIADLPWKDRIIPVMMLLLGGLMLSDVPYLAVPTIGLRTWRQRTGTVIVLGSVAGIIWGPKQFIFPALMAYIVTGLLQWVVLGLIQRRTSPHPVYWDEEPDDGNDTEELMGRPLPPDRLPAAARPLSLTEEVRIGRRRRHRRRHQGGQQGNQPPSQSSNPTDSPSHEPEPPKSPA